MFLDYEIRLHDGCYKMFLKNAKIQNIPEVISSVVKIPHISRALFFADVFQITFENTATLLETLKPLHIVLQKYFQCEDECFHVHVMNLLVRNIRELTRKKLTFSNDMLRHIDNLKHNEFKLFPHQEDGIEFILNHAKCILASDMGLGKSIMSLTAMAIRSHNSITNNLIICPAALKTNWMQEIGKFTKLEFFEIKSKKHCELLFNTYTKSLTKEKKDIELEQEKEEKEEKEEETSGDDHNMQRFKRKRRSKESSSVAQDTTPADGDVQEKEEDSKNNNKKRRKNVKKERVSKKFEDSKNFTLHTKNILISYSLLSACMQYLSEVKWNLLICDEAHYIKNSKSKRSKAIKQLTSNNKIPYVILMTGTPANRSCDLWNLLRIIDSKTFQYFYTHVAPRNFQQRLSCHERRKNFYFADRYIIPEVVRVTRGQLRYDYTKNTRLDELHALTRCFILRQKIDDCIDLPPIVEEYIELAPISSTDAKYYKQQLEKMQECSNKIEADLILNTLIQHTGELKKKHLVSYLLTICETIPKCVVFVFFEHMVEYVSEELKKHHIQHITIYGKTKQNERYDLIKRFETEESCKIGIFSFGVGSTGFNLTFANFVVYGELTFDAVKHIQSLGRCRRIGQEKKVIAQFLTLKNTTDTFILSSLESKKRTSEHIL